MSVGDRLKKILGHTYGGPSISYEDGAFVLYQWYDAPVSEVILAKGKTLTELLDNYKPKKRS